jgi:hypothetical protein
MLLGPLTEIDANYLKDKLKTFGKASVITIDPNLVEEKLEQDKIRNRYEDKSIYSAHRKIGDTPVCFYIEVELADILIIKSDLDKMGITLDSKRDLNPDFRDEFICPICKRTSLSEGFCTEHPATELLKYDVYLQSRQLKSERTSKIVTRILLTLAGILILYFSIQNFYHPSLLKP